MLRIALIGGGRTVRIGHAPALQALHDRFHVVAMADASPEALETTGMMLGIPPEHRYTDYRAMLAAMECDIVDISLPHAFHHEAAIAALHAGAHLITERPLALSERDAEELLRMAESRGRLITVLHFYKYYAPFHEAIRLIRKGEIGTPFLVRCEGVTGGFGPGTDAYHPEWHADPMIAGGGVWIDSGYHAIYLCNAMMGSPANAIAANITTVSPDLKVDDTVAALLTHANGGTSTIQAAWSVPSGGRRVFEIYGAEGTIAFDHEGNEFGFFSNRTRTWHHPALEVEHAGSFIGIFTALAECLEYGAPPPVPHREALHTLHAVLAGYRASDRATVEAISGM
jgi:predicted dehydrogenase